MKLPVEQAKESDNSGSTLATGTKVFARYNVATTEVLETFQQNLTHVKTVREMLLEGFTMARSGKVRGIMGKKAWKSGIRKFLSSRGKQKKTLETTHVLKIPEAGRGQARQTQTRILK